MSKGKFALIAASLIFIALRIHAGEFPDKWTWDDKPDLRADHAAMEGKPLRPLNVSGWINGTIKADDMKGKVVVIDFYATWCGPCMRAIPHNNELVAKYKDKGLVLFGVCTDKSGQEKMADVVKAHNMEYPTAADPKLISEKTWNVHYYPTYAVIDRKGIVRVVGLQPDHLDAVVQKLLAEPAQ
jgi:thiol-disulfide isomerase/thioredoxin